MTPRHFKNALELRRWFARNHETARELWIGFYKKHTGKPSITWPESVDEALCVGWIDGIRKRLSDEAYTIRFTPRKPGSIWSAVNSRRVEALKKDGRMQPAGLAAYARKKENKAGVYSYEQRPQELPAPYAGQFKKHKAAWSFFQAQTPSYRKRCTWWVISAKQEATRQRRLASLIEYSAHHIALPAMAPPPT